MGKPPQFNLQWHWEVQENRVNTEMLCKIKDHMRIRWLYSQIKRTIYHQLRGEGHKDLMETGRPVRKLEFHPIMLTTASFDLMGRMNLGYARTQSNRP